MPELRAAMLAPLLLYSCAAPAGDGGPMRVNSVDELRTTVQARYSALLAGTGGDLDIALAPGRYEVGSFGLADMASKGNVRVRLYGDGGPAEIVGSQLTIDGASIELRNLVLSGYTNDSPVLQLRVKDSLILDHVALVDNVRADAKRVVPLVRLTGAYRSGPKTVSIKDSWFLGNDVGTASLLAGDAVKPDRFGSITIENTVFAGNNCLFTLAPGLADAVTVKGSAVSSGTVFGYAMNGLTKWTFAGDKLAVPGLVTNNPKLDAATFSAPEVDGPILAPNAPNIEPLREAAHQGGAPTDAHKSAVAG
jgi:hypothetical protein